MSQVKRLSLGFAGIVLAAASALGQPAARPDYDANFIGPPLRDPVIQHAKETYVLYGCAYCHGIDLMSRGEATDLMHSRLVGRDVNGSLIVPLLKAGIPQTAKLSPMPQYSDLSDRQLADIATWIHYARQQGRYNELMRSNQPGNGNAAAGKTYFDQTCNPCHTSPSQLRRTFNRLDTAAIRARVLRPAFLDAARSWKMGEMKDTKAPTVRQQHLSLLENYSSDDVANVVACLQSAK